MAAWSGLLALSGFQYDGPRQALTAVPRSAEPNFRCFWSTATAWGVFSTGRNGLNLQVHKGSLACRACTFRAASGSASAMLNGTPVAHGFRRQGEYGTVEFSELMQLKPGDRLEIRA
jgi:hypothetical protein